jgi:MFS family permease
MTKQTKVFFPLVVLFAINTMNFYDRQILGAVGETIRDEWKLSDAALGTLGTAFTLLYAVVGVPLGRLTDRSARTWILSAGVTVWSLFTALSGMAQSFTQLFAVRLAVGVGEASCAPAASSLIGDLFPPEKRAKALSVFMMGLPIGIALSFAASGWLALRYGWRSAFYIAGIPGLICAALILMVKEPQRGASEAHKISGMKREGSPYWLVLSIPTMWWLILSGALHNFNMYALGAFLSSFLQRVYKLDRLDAGLIAMVVYGLSGIPGLILGGLLGDSIMKRRKDGRLLVAAITMLVSVPLIYFALALPAGSVAMFTLLLTLGCAMMYVYYATVYSTIQDVIEPSLRGTAMALYFFAMYVCGASLGPLGTGALSSYYTGKAALEAGVTETTFEALRPFGAQGLHSAMYIIPVLSIVLTLVLYAGSRTVTKDMNKMQDWMRENAEKPKEAEVAAGD